MVSLPQKTEIRRRIEIDGKSSHELLSRKFLYYMFYTERLFAYLSGRQVSVRTWCDIDKDSAGG